MINAFAILPILLCACVILIARLSALAGALIGLITAFLLILSPTPFTLSLAHIGGSALDSILLSLNAALVILPGLYFSAILKENGSLATIQNWVAALSFSPERKALLILFGLAPIIESLIGFGISLLITIPLFFHIFPSRTAYRLSMLSMMTRPWGTLGIATLMGATLSGQDAASLGVNSVLLNSLAYPAFGFIALYLIGGFPTLKHSFLPALGLSLALMGLLALFNAINLVEISGVLSGAGVFILGFICFSKRSISPAPQNHKNLLVAFSFYGLILLLILMERLIPGLYDTLAHLVVFTSPHTSFSLLTSPGIVLGLVVLLLFSIKQVTLNHKDLLTRWVRTTAPLFLFILLAQIMVRSGMIEAFSQMLSGLPDSILIFCSPLIGMISGFMTGSNMGGNALTMSLQSHIGGTLGLNALFSAAQNAGAGDALFTSIPGIVMILGLAGEITHDDEAEKNTKEHHLLSFGLKAALLIFTCLIIPVFTLKGLM
ncbi:L-lactate permease [Acetobacteraceae bacterium ESL0709]|nr:L-lactate permease [Acetobacteraceae bacterium ESL0697]MDF7678457.1 L-lactate permease [Acetobacteraceae bacterium ESL0709]